jgi:hypothetical protein
VTQGELAVAVDAVVADAVGAGVQWGAGRGCFGSGEIGLVWGVTAQCAVWAHGVVVGAEGVELGLELGDVVGRGLVGEPFFQGFGGSVRPCRRSVDGRGGSGES